MLDFVDAYWSGWHFWAFNVADAAITVGVMFMILDILRARTPCIQSCLTLGPITIYSYGVLLAAAYLIGLWMAVRRARAAGVDGNRIMDLLIWVIIAALVGAKALLFIVDFQHFTRSWQEFTTLLRSGGVFYGGLIAAILVCICQLQEAPAAAVDLGRSVRARHRARLHGGPARLPDGRLLLRQTHRPWRGRSRSRIPRPTSTSARR